MISKVIVTAAALFLLALGIGLDFLPQEAAARIGLGTTPMAALPLQVLAAAFLGMGFLNWFSKANPMGGIYSRPLALQNFLCFGVGAVPLDRAALHGGVPPALGAAAVVFTLFALAFAYLLFFHDPIGRVQTESTGA